MKLIRIEDVGQTLSNFNFDLNLFSHNREGTLVNTDADENTKIELLLE